MRSAAILALLLVMAACTHRRENPVVFHLNGAFNRQFAIERTGFNGQPSVTLDSGIGKSNKDSFVYYLPSSQASVYSIRIQNKVYLIPFIYDSTGMSIIYNYTTDKYHYQNSPASSEWKAFQDSQAVIGNAATAYERNLQFADTVTNPALFLLAYNLVDFGTDYKALQQFIERAGRRFPTHTGVQTLVRKTLDFIRIFSNPLKIGDTLASFELPDTSGKTSRIGPLRNKYVFIDCWSTWCESCRLHSPVKKRVYHQIDTSRLEMIGIAVDGEKDAWKKVIAYEKYPWRQLIDQEMWTGPAARALRFDSIPLNFLVAPGGRIVAKGIPPDSLPKLLASYKLLHH
jgi:peroxiredoxin